MGERGLPQAGLLTGGVVGAAVWLALRCGWLARKQVETDLARVGCVPDRGLARGRGTGIWGWCAIETQGEFGRLL